MAIACTENSQSPVIDSHFKIAAFMCFFGPILIIIGLIKGIFREPQFLCFIWISIFSFIVSLLSSVINMKQWIVYMALARAYIFAEGKTQVDLEKKLKFTFSFSNILTTITIITFLLGMLSIIPFAIINISN